MALASLATASFCGGREHARIEASSALPTMPAIRIDFDGLFARAVERRQQFNIGAPSILRLTLSPGSRCDNVERATRLTARFSSIVDAADMLFQVVNARIGARRRHSRVPGHAVEPGRRGAAGPLRRVGRCGRRHAHRETLATGCRRSLACAVSPLPRGGGAADSGTGNRLHVPPTQPVLSRSAGLPAHDRHRRTLRRPDRISMHRSIRRRLAAQSPIRTFPSSRGGTRCSSVAGRFTS